MSLDVSLEEEQIVEVFSQNITHNLNKMAEALGIYKAVWRPEEINFTKAKQLIEPLENAIKLMREDPEKYKKFDAENGWGTYRDFLPWLKKYLAACKESPNARIEVSR